MNLRRFLASIVLTTASGCPGACPERPPIDEVITIPTTPDENVQADLDACESDETKCDPLCEELFLEVDGEDVFVTSCKLTTDASGNEAVHGVGAFRCIGGRRPAGYRRGRPCGSAVGAYLAQQAELEAASVRAFDDLAADAMAHRAPASLIRAIRRAAADEVRHARTCHALARRHGVTPRYAPIAIAARRTRRELAVDNAVEGCVRETLGAVIAGYQARTAADPAIRTAMARIWRDEAKHAALSWRLHRWIAPRLDAGDRRAMAVAIADARRELADARPEHADVHAIAGVPTARVAAGMLAQLDALYDTLTTV